MHRFDSSRQCIELKYDWRFVRTELKAEPSPSPESVGIPFSDWETVRVPHDWAIKGPFDRNHDLQITSVIEDGIPHDMVHTARTGGLPIVGEGWYRRQLDIPGTYVGKRIFIEFGGVMSDSTVFLNGHEVGSWPYGYSSFSFELTDFIQFGGDNVLDVRVCSLPGTSRFYPGAGIYRAVRLVVTEPVHIAHWGTKITTPVATAEKAVVEMATTIHNQSGMGQQVKLATILLDPAGQEVLRDTVEQTVIETETISRRLEWTNPALWDIVAPNMYKAVSIVYVDGQETDRYETAFGVRTIAFDANRGFFLNGHKVKLQGVCLHHDLGALGAAFHYRSMQRQLELLQQMGCNAIRTSHNPPAPELLDLCDRMGLLVIDEAFDEWALGKVKNGYFRLFKDWAEKDLRAMLRRDRNHPCIIMWSIGNEIREQGAKDGAQVAQFLTDICHEEDTTRPVTAGFNNADAAIRNGLADVVDIPGFNYKPHLYKKYHEEHPDWVIYGSETASTVSTRGIYEFSAEPEKPVLPRPNLQINSNDLATPGWGTTPDQEFLAQEECEFSLGEFVWTGFDYLGEPTPYREEWPSRSSYFGILDLCGIPKDRYYLYQSHWSDRPVLHLLPHWNWSGHEGETIPVQCYTSYDQAELFLNGKSLGIRKKSDQSLYDRYRLIWKDVKYEPGVLKVVAYDHSGTPVENKEMRTAGEPARIELAPDQLYLKADGDDLCYITFRIVDRDGVLCPTADHRVSFTIAGAGEIVATDNGDPTDVESFASHKRKVLGGQGMVIVRSLQGQPGELTIVGVSDGLAGASVKLRSRIE